MPSEGIKINGEFIQAPSEEVLEYKDRNAQNTILVRFFDGRRTWYGSTLICLLKFNYFILGNGCHRQRLSIWEKIRSLTYHWLMPVVAVSGRFNKHTKEP